MRSPDTRARVVLAVLAVALSAVPLFAQEQRGSVGAAAVDRRGGPPGARTESWHPDRADEPADSGCRNRPGAKPLGAERVLVADQQLDEQSFDEPVLRRSGPGHRRERRDRAGPHPEAADWGELFSDLGQLARDLDEHLQQFRSAAALDHHVQRHAAAPPELQDRQRPSAARNEQEGSRGVRSATSVDDRPDHPKRQECLLGARLSTSRIWARSASRSTWPDACSPTTRSGYRSARWLPSTSWRRSRRSPATTNR